MQDKVFPTLFLLVPSKTCTHVVVIDCNFMGSHVFEFVCLLRAGSVLQVDTFKLRVSETPLIAGQVVRRVVVSQLFTCMQQLFTWAGTASQMDP